MGSNLTQSQMLMWAGQQLHPDSPLYNVVFTFRLKGAINTDYFRMAFQALVDRSDALRTIFENTNDGPSQKVLARFVYELPVLDWSSFPETENKLKKWVDRKRLHHFNLGEPLFDSALIKLSEHHFIWYVNLHHLINDAWAFTVLYKKMAELYKKAEQSDLESAGGMPSFDRYIRFEKLQKNDDSREAINAYWKEKVALKPAYPKLYGYNNNITTTLSRRVSVDLGQQRSDRLRTLSLQPGIRTFTQDLTLFQIFTTALFAFIFRVSGQNRFAIGTPAHNRVTEEFKNTVGLFIEFFPLIVDIDEDETFGSLLEKVRAEANDFLRFAQPGAVTSELTSSFNVILNYIHAGFTDFNGIPTDADWIHPGHSDTSHHLRLQVHDFDKTGSIQLFFDLHAEVFDDLLQQNVPQHFLNLLDAFIEDWQAEIRKPPLITGGPENIPSVKEAHESVPPVPVVKLFEHSAALDPETLALRFGNESWSYDKLNTSANNLAHYLLKEGIGKGERIAIYSKRTPAFVAAVLAVLKTGAAYIPVSTEYPVERVKYMIEDGGAGFLLAEQQLYEKLENVDIPFLPLGNLENLTVEDPASNPETEIEPSDAVYIMYTSGSTGKPKGVVISHGALSNYIRFAKNQYMRTEAPVFPLFTSVGFDLTVTSLFTPLVCGGQLVIYEESNSGPDLSLMNVVKDNLVDAIKLTPSHLALIRGMDLSGSRVRTIIVGGEDFKTELADAILESFKDKPDIYNEYGPTEGTVGCILHKYSGNPEGLSSVPIGRPVAGMQAFVLDTFLNSVPKGVPGELFIAGPGLAAGYWNRDDLTRERFIAHPDFDNKRLYKTGDLVRINKNGQLEFLGRMDHQVKVGGMRIELGEIEAALSAHTDIENAVVVMHGRSKPMADHDIRYCVRCGLPSNYPDAEYNDEGVCQLCLSFENYQKKAEKYFKTMDDLKAIFKDSRSELKGEYDCLALLSGGKDSTYALARLIDMGLNVLAFTLDNGYISEQALDNVRRVTNELGVDHIIGTTEAMNTIFIDSLRRYSNVCNGCFKTIYTLSTKIALEKKIPFIVTGLSRGQFFETRLTEELFWNDEVDVDKIDQIILNARKAYHRVEDAVCQTLDVSMFETDEVFEKVQFLDFYRFCDVHLDDMLAYLDKKLPWVRPTDTGRSTNCLINQVGIYVHKKEQGYNNYAFPYSWDVRMGHKSRDAALEEINEEVDEKEVKRIMAEIGYTEGLRPKAGDKRLVAYYQSKKPVPSSRIKAHLKDHLPDYMIPALFIHLEELPLSSNGKIDRSALPQPVGTRAEINVKYVAPETEFEEILTDIWTEVLQVSRIGVNDNFLDLGGNSLAAIRLAARVNEAFELELQLNKVFEYPTVRSLATHIEETIIALLEELGED